MTDALPGKRYGTLQAWPDPADAARPATRWRYLPLAPAPQRTPAGGPRQVTMIEAGGVLMLTVGAMLGASEDALAATRAAIGAEAGVRGGCHRPAAGGGQCAAGNPCLGGGERRAPATGKGDPFAHPALSGGLLGDAAGRRRRGRQRRAEAPRRGPGCCPIRRRTRRQQGGDRADRGELGRQRRCRNAARGGAVGAGCRRRPRRFRRADRGGTGRGYAGRARGDVDAVSQTEVGRR